MSQNFSAPDVSDRSIDSLLSLAGRRAVVTGAGRGIGKAIARRLAEAGAAIAIGDVDESSAVAAAAELTESFGVDAVGLPVDIRSRESVDAFADAVGSKLGGLDIWVNNAAIFPTNQLLDTPDEEWAAVVDVDLTGTFYACRAAAKAMSGDEDRSGKVILNMTSMAGLRGRKGIAAYVSAKHGVSGMTKALGLELAPAGIRVMAVAPSVVDTPGVRQLRQSSDEEDEGRSEELLSGLVAGIPLGRAGVPDDIARVVLFSVSDACVWMTGTIIPVDGGTAAM